MCTKLKCSSYAMHLTWCPMQYSPGKAQWGLKLCRFICSFSLLSLYFRFFLIHFQTFYLSSTPDLAFFLTEQHLHKCLPPLSLTDFSNSAICCYFRLGPSSTPNPLLGLERQAQNSPMASHHLCFNTEGTVPSFLLSLSLKHPGKNLHSQPQWKPSGNPWGNVWLHLLWSLRLLSRNRFHLVNLKMHKRRT